MKIFLAAMLIFLAADSFAQFKGFSIGPYAEMAWPTGRLDNTNKKGLGAGFGADIRFGKIGFTGSAGYMHFPGKTLTTTDGNFKNESLAGFPIRAGIKFRPLPFLYFKLESGTVNLNKDRGRAFIFSPGIGLRLLGLDVLAKYENWKADENFSFWGLKLGYNF